MLIVPVELPFQPRDYDRRRYPTVCGAVPVGVTFWQQDPNLLFRFLCPFGPIRLFVGPAALRIRQEDAYSPDGHATGEATA
jgi:hypothetical protein